MLKNMTSDRSVAVVNRDEQSLTLSLPGDDGLMRHGQKRVLIIEAWNATPHLETGLEVALRLAAGGYKVAYMHIGECLPCVEFYNRFGGSLKEKLLGYSSPQAKGIRGLRRFCAKLSLKITFIKPSPIFCRNNFVLPRSVLASFQDLVKYSPSDYPKLGISVASSLASLLRSSLVIPSDHAELCNELATSYLRSHAITGIAIHKFKPDSLIVFNGRFACTKGIAIAAIQRNLRVFYHERGSSKDRFSLFPFQPHNRIELQKQILQHWHQFKACDSARASASKYFVEQADGISRDWTSFVASQKAGFANEILEKSRLSAKGRKVITYFTSSEDEFIACADAWQPDKFEWSNQIGALESLIRAAAKRDYSIVVRVHPHLLHKDKQEQMTWDTLSFIPPQLRSNLTIVPSDSAVSSYELLHLSDAVATYGSTIGIEAVYWEKPSILLGNSDYDQCCDSIYQPKTVKELDALLSNIGHLRVCRESAYPYGFHRAESGTDFLFYKADSLFSGNIFEANLQDSRKTILHRALFKMKRRFIYSFK